MKALLFDLDGVLWFSESMHKDAFIMALRDEIADAVSVINETWEFGESTESYLKRLAQLGHIIDESKNFERLKIKKREIAGAKSKNQSLLNSSLINYLVSLSNYSIKFGLVSSSSPYNVRNFLHLSSLENFFDVVVDGSKVPNPKPAGDGYLYALRQIEIQTKCVLAVEDSPSGIESAINAGISNILVYPDHQLEEKIELFLEEV